MTLKRKAVIVKFQIFLNSIESGLSLNTIPLYESWSLVGSLFTFFQIEVWSLVVGFSCGRKSWRKHFWSNYENQQKNLKGKTVTSDSWIEPRPQRSHHCVIRFFFLGCNCDSWFENGPLILYNVTWTLWANCNNSLDCLIFKICKSKYISFEIYF